MAAGLVYCLEHLTGSLRDLSCSIAGSDFHLSITGLVERLGWVLTPNVDPLHNQSFPPPVGSTFAVILPLGPPLLGVLLAALCSEPVLASPLRGAFVYVKVCQLCILGNSYQLLCSVTGSHKAGLYGQVGQREDGRRARRRCPVLVISRTFKVHSFVKVNLWSNGVIKRAALYRIMFSAVCHGILP